MTDPIIQFLKEINIIQLVAIGAIVWFFYSRLDNKIAKLDAKFEDKFDKLSEKVEDVDRRLCRIEGSLSSHGHCLFNQTQPEKKA
jgi:hypothetical protein